jgi:two-component system response regulator NreC
MTSKLRILLADDHETVREGLKMIINSQPDMEVVGEAGDGQAAISRARELLPDIVVMDVSMPRLNGLKATEKLREICPQVKVVTLSRHADDGYIQQLLKAGARGYVLKQSAASELLRAIRVVTSGNTFLDPKLVPRVIDTYKGRSNTLRGEPNNTLSDRESEVLRFISLGYSNKEIAAKLSLSIKTIEAHKANAMRKLNISSRIDLLRHAMLKGWLEDS